MDGINADDLVLFVKVAEAKSFSDAAVRLGIAKSTLSRRITALEAQLGESLFHRSPRSLTLTDFGLSMLSRAAAVAADLEGAKAFAQHRQAKPRGHLRVSVPSDLARTAMPEMLARFIRQHSGVVLELDANPRRVDLIAENFDLALRVGEIDSGSHKVQKLAETRAGLYAAPSYLGEVGAPEAPGDLVGLHGLLYALPSGGARPWTLVRNELGGDEYWEGTPRTYTVGNSPSLLLAIAEAGYGVVMAPRSFAKRAVDEGRLQPVLPDWEKPLTAYSVVLPGEKLVPTKARAFIDALKATIRDDEG